MIDVLEPENLAAAWKKVKANKGKAGIDGMEVGDFPAFMREHWEKLRGKLEDGSYKPSPVRRVEIPKDGGGKRTLGIPTVLDRMIQQAIAQVLTPLYDPTFSDASFGLPSLRSRHAGLASLPDVAAIAACRVPADAQRTRRHHSDGGGGEENRKQMPCGGLRSGEVVDDGPRRHPSGLLVSSLSRSARLDTVDNQKLMGRLRQRITDPGLLALILKYLKAAAISRQGHFEEQLMGVPQGGPLSTRSTWPAGAARGTGE